MRPSIEKPPRVVKGRATKEYAAYHQILYRCFQKSPSMKRRFKNTRYAGMEVEVSWLGPEGFDNFYHEVGPAPPNAVIDRINNNKGYVAGNVRWTTYKQSNSNKGDSRLITAFGITKHLKEWADELGVRSTTISVRLDRLGWSPEDAVKRPIRGRK